LFITNILYWAKSQFEGQKIVKSKIEIHIVIEDLLRVFCIELKDKQINLSNNIDLDIEIICDKKHI
jgi:hypothetical protein